MKNNKRQNKRSEDFIGKTFNDGKLKVISIAGKDSWGVALFKVTCEICSKDSELFPDGYLISTKNNLIAGNKPCGCSKRYKWSEQQYLVLAKRVAKEKSFIVNGIIGEFNGIHTRLDCECIIHNHKWSPSIHHIVQSKTRCPKCSKVYRCTEQEALDRCITICQEMKYEPIRFLDGYKNNKSKFSYICQTHGHQSVEYNSFVNSTRRCRGCWKDRQLEILRDRGNGNGYYPERKGEQDFLYVLNFNNTFIKVGRSFNICKRLRSLRTVSKISISKIHKLRIFTATHQEIYDYEQELLLKLKELHFQYSVNWSNECFVNDSLPVLNEMLSECGLKEILHADNRN